VLSILELRPILRHRWYRLLFAIAVVCGLQISLWMTEAVKLLPHVGLLRKLKQHNLSHFRKRWTENPLSDI